ncbi:MAG: hypothetical protein KGY99_04905 [Phycisphaerae bacterium]|nr:hypothetical protein [Phycisphaerae bacterium]
MELTPTRKAALLLMNLDASTAAELLGSADADKVAEIAAEVAYLKASGHTPQGADEPVREFYGLLEQSDAGGGSSGMFVEQMLERALGAGQGRQTMQRVRELVEAKDPFLPIRSASVEDLTEALSGETPQAVAVVLGELPQKTSGKLLGALTEDVRAAAIRTLASGAPVSAETKVRVASVMRRRLEARQAGGEPATGDARLRQVAVLLRGLGNELRNSMLESIREQNAETASGVERMMVVWEDLPVIADRSMQEALREIEARQLALALSDAEEAVREKIRSNMSERGAAMLDEEASLLSSPGDEDIQAGREAVLSTLRDMSSKGSLNFEEGS